VADPATWKVPYELHFLLLQKNWMDGWVDGWMDRLDQNKSTKTIGSYQNRRKHIFLLIFLEFYIHIYIFIFIFIFLG
jgi:hypothetical protein